MRDLRGARISMVMQDPKFSLNPVITVGDQIAEALRTHETPAAPRRPRPRGRDAGAGADQRPRAGGEALSAPGLRRHGPAGDDRDDADPAAGPADRRRADLGARRLGAGAGARPDRRAGAPERHGADPDQPRPRPRRALLRPHPGDERRPRGRGMPRRRPRARRRIPTPAASSPRCRACARTATSCRCSTAPPGAAHERAGARACGHRLLPASGWCTTRASPSPRARASRWSARAARASRRC